MGLLTFLMYDIQQNGITDLSTIFTLWSVALSACMLYVSYDTIRVEVNSHHVLCSMLSFVLFAVLSLVLYSEHGPPWVAWSVVFVSVQIMWAVRPVNYLLSVLKLVFLLKITGLVFP
jgi:hypothetical protein